MEFVTELTAFLENKPGRLAKICSALAHEKINIRALAVMDASERSVLRLVTSDLEATRRVMTSLGTETQAAEVVSVEIDPKPGALAKLLEVLAEAHINIEYAYLAEGGSAGKALAILHTSNPKKTQQLLSEQNQVNGHDSSGGRRPLHARR